MRWLRPKSKRSSAPGRTQPLILVIDDEKDLCRILNLALTDAGYLVEFAYDGLDGLEKARALRPALILLDIKMPKLNGYQVLTQLQQDGAISNTPVIIISIIDEEGEYSSEEWMRRLGVQGYLAKPFDPRLAVEQIRVILGQHGPTEGKTRPADPA